MMKKDQFFGNAEAQAKMLFVFPRGVCLVEPVKDIRFALIRNAAALIHDLQRKGMLLKQWLGADTDRTAGRSVISGIVKKNQKQLPDSLGIAKNQGQGILGKFQAKGDPLLLTDRLKGFI